MYPFKITINTIHRLQWRIIPVNIFFKWEDEISATKIIKLEINSPAKNLNLKGARDTSFPQFFVMSTKDEFLVKNKYLFL
jgi:hypothetical protein